MSDLVAIEGDLLDRFTELLGDAEEKFVLRFGPKVIARVEIACGVSLWYGRHGGEPRLVIDFLGTVIPLVNASFRLRYESSAALPLLWSRCEDFNRVPSADEVRDRAEVLRTFLGTEP